MFDIQYSTFRISLFFPCSLLLRYLQEYFRVLLGDSEKGLCRTLRFPAPLFPILDRARTPIKEANSDCVKLNLSRMDLADTGSFSSFVFNLYSPFYVF